ncbi:helix-turn-helix transcriptional regulator [Desulfoluna spongiiphila]|uniref:Helix-turn-helix n=1 Tax=Desulfoluna spongiiphila TaxID=419481 RepID=A0A1G5CHH1_9BACT|nr:helix-turn-helix domain-containing protein [Desulfoluna spongiiphila]SCY01768.1 Helix-turn-helix [Desulfoluna spongiiphila]
MEHVATLLFMKTSIYDKWLQIFIELLNKEGRGSQARIARVTGKSTKHINDIVKGRRRASLDLQEEIAKIFGLTYEKMLNLGAPQEPNEPFPKYNEVMMLPLEERAWAIARIAAEKHNITGFMSFHGGRDSNEKPELIAKFLKGELTEEGFYNEACSFFEEMEKNIKAQLAKRGF